MTGKERILNAIAGKKSDMCPLTIHGWGQYKFAMQGIIKDYSEEEAAWGMHGDGLAEVEEKFREAFPVDWMHLSEGRFFDDIKLRIQAPERAGLLKEVRRLESKQAIDEFLDQIYLSVEEFENGTKFEHLKTLSKKYGDELFVVLHTEGPIYDIGDKNGILEFEGMMMAMLEKPEMFAYLARGMHQRQLRYVEAVKRCGAHSYTQSEGYFTPDLVSPEVFERTMLDVLIEFYGAVGEMGLVPMCYYLGDVTGHVKYIKRMGFKGLILEESKKSMAIDPAKIIRELGEDRAVFGNVDSIGALLKGSREDIRAAAHRQIKDAGSNSFVAGIGSPIPFGTPPENIRAFIDAVREYS